MSSLLWTRPRLEVKMIVAGPYTMLLISGPHDQKRLGASDAEEA